MGKLLNLVKWFWRAGLGLFYLVKKYSWENWFGVIIKLVKTGFGELVWGDY